jgi:hypothetical protein
VVRDVSEGASCHEDIRLYKYLQSSYLMDPLCEADTNGPSTPRAFLINPGTTSLPVQSFSVSPYFFSNVINV